MQLNVNLGSSFWKERRNAIVNRGFSFKGKVCSLGNLWNLLFQSEIFLKLSQIQVRYEVDSGMQKMLRFWITLEILCPLISF